MQFNKFFVKIVLTTIILALIKFLFRSGYGTRPDNFRRHYKRRERVRFPRIEKETAGQKCLLKRLM